MCQLRQGSGISVAAVWQKSHALGGDFEASKTVSVKLLSTLIPIQVPQLREPQQTCRSLNPAASAAPYPEVSFLRAHGERAAHRLHGALDPEKIRGWRPEMACC